MRNSLLFILIMFAFSLHAQENVTLTQTFEKGKAKTVKLLMSISGGEVNMGGTTTKLAEVDMKYLEDYWQPVMSYTDGDKQGKFQLKTNTSHDDTEIENANICNLALNSELEYLVGMQIGVGLAEINLENFNLKKGLFRLGIGSFNVNLRNTSVPYLKIDAGIGQANFDLSGTWNNDLKAKVTTGIGEITFIVPKDVGVVFNVQGILGDIVARGFAKDGNSYTNRAYGKTKHTLEFNLKGAIGNINIVEK